MSTDATASLAGKELPVALTFDLDPDHFDPTIGHGYGSDMLAWLGVEHGVPKIAELLDRMTDDFGNRACATWLPRADNQIGAIYGDCGAILDRFQDLLHTLADNGDEIGWHPHLHRRTDRRWVQEKDPERLADILDAGHAALTARGWNPRATRMGGNYGSFATMQKLQELGIEVDSSAMPGRSRQDDHVDFDWSKTTSRPFRPGHDDHSVPGTPSHDLIEVPLGMAQVRAAYDDRPYPRYVDLSFHPRALGPGLEALIEHAEILVTDTHPSTVLSEVAAAPHGLLSFSLEAFRENLSLIVETCARQGRHLRFVTLSDPRLRANIAKAA